MVGNESFSDFSSSLIFGGEGDVLPCITLQFHYTEHHLHIHKVQSHAARNEN